jgi:ribonuclease E
MTEHAAPAVESIAQMHSEPLTEESAAETIEAPRPKPAPAVVIVSPIEAAAAAVKQEEERPAGRAANDPREVRKREREARLRQEGVIGERSPE